MTRSSRSLSRRALAGAVLATALVIAGCGPAAQTGGVDEEGRVEVLTFGDFGGGSNPKENYNPFLEGQNLAAFGYIYEPLMLINEYSCDPEPWLATEYAWTDPQTLTFTLREGVTWNDGEPFTAEDVAFTFAMIRDNPALDTQGVWRYLSDVRADDERTVTFAFSSPGASAFTLVNAVRIVPEHIWADVADPVSFVNADDPVGTGPYMLDAFNPQRLTIARNPDYWNADAIKVNKIQFVKSDTGQVEQLKLARGDYDQNAAYIPDIEKAYVAKDPEHHHYWFPAGSPISLFMNTEKKPFDDAAFRAAIAQAIDKEEIVQNAQQGYVDVASQTGLVLPNNEEWLPDDLSDGGYVTFDADAAGAALDAAGYPLEGDRRVGPDGTPLEFTFKVPGGWNDWVQAAKVVQSNLEDIGIGIDLQTPTPEVTEQDRRTGEYDFVFGVRGGSCNMFRNFQEPLASDQTAPTGEEAATNEIRWRDAETDALIEQLRVAVDESAQKEAVAGLARIMVDEVPYIPLWYGANWFQYTTRQVEGWPSEEDPYAKPANMLLILTRLEPVADGG